MKISKFEEILAWQKSQEIAVEVYSLFGKMKDFGFRDQICRAAISISNNIAEGFERNTDKDFARFLHISLGSCSEVKSMLYLGERLNLIDINQQRIMLDKVQEVSKIITGLIKSLR